MRLRLSLLPLALAVAGCDTPAPPDAPAAASGVVYRCESERLVRAAYPSADTAVVEYEGEKLSMNRAQSASGARYVGAGMEWWTRGTGPGAEGSLFRHDSHGNATGVLMEACLQAADSLTEDPDKKEKPHG